MVTNCANNCAIFNSRVNFLQGVAASFIYLNGLLFMILSVSDKLQANPTILNYRRNACNDVYIFYTNLAGGFYLLDKCFNFDDNALFMSSKMSVTSCIILNAFITGIMIPTMP